MEWIITSRFIYTKIHNYYEQKCASCSPNWGHFNERLLKASQQFSVPGGSLYSSLAGGMSAVFCFFFSSTNDDEGEEEGVVRSARCLFFFALDFSSESDRTAGWAEGVSRVELTWQAVGTATCELSFTGLMIGAWTVQLWFLIRCGFWLVIAVVAVADEAISLVSGLMTAIGGAFGDSHVPSWFIVDGPQIPEATVEPTGRKIDAHWCWSSISDLGIWTVPSKDKKTQHDCCYRSHVLKPDSNLRLIHFRKFFFSSLGSVQWSSYDTQGGRRNTGEQMSCETKTLIAYLMVVLSTDE